jgi:crossover junction endodeoxyribonuclease RusA
LEALSPPRTLTIELPYPPSVNHYWRRVGPRTLISREGRRFRARVGAMLALRRIQPINGSLDVRVAVHPPDRRRRDLDNAMKALLDALEHAGAYSDDSQIDHLDITRGTGVPEGKVIVHITEVRHDGTAAVPT